MLLMEYGIIAHPFCLAGYEKRCCLRVSTRGRKLGKEPDICNLRAGPSSHPVDSPVQQLQNIPCCTGGVNLAKEVPPFAHWREIRGKSGS
jgi:hypothetical protein